jgi:hypothetical protein
LRRCFNILFGNRGKKSIFIFHDPFFLFKEERMRSFALLWIPLALFVALLGACGGIGVKLATEFDDVWRRVGEKNFIWFATACV